MSTGEMIQEFIKAILPMSPKHELCRLNLEILHDRLTRTADGSESIGALFVCNVVHVYKLCGFHTVYNYHIIYIPTMWKQVLNRTRQQLRSRGQ